jgi:hypothetical protein
MLSKIFSFLIQPLFIIFPRLQFEALAIHFQEDSKQKEVMINNYTTTLAVFLKSLISDNPATSSLDLAIYIGYGEIKQQDKTPESLWLVWTEEDLYEFLITKLNLSPEKSQEISSIYPLLIYEMKRYSERGNVNNEKLFDALSQNPDFSKYFN